MKKKDIILGEKKSINIVGYYINRGFQIFYPVPVQSE